MKDRYNFNDKENLIKDIKQLQDYDGYIQFSDTKLRECDIFQNDDIATKIDPTDGFVYEAHFSNGKKSIAIRQINGEWIVSETDISNVSEEDKEIYHAKGKNVIMAQVWKEEKDPLCEWMEVKKLKKVVFAGFEKGEKQ